MSTTPPASPAAEPPERARLLAIEVGDWPGLDQPGRLELSAGTTVLVGKNGAGKSLLVEGFFWAAKQAAQWFARSEKGSPRYFRCEIEPRDHPAFAYVCEVQGDEPDEEPEEPDMEPDPWRAMRAHLPSWRERGLRLGDGVELWRAENHHVFIGNRRASSALRGVLSLNEKEHPEIEAESRALGAIVGQVHLIGPGTLYRSSDFLARDMRRAVLLQQKKEEGTRRAKARWAAAKSSEVDELAEAIAGAWQDHPGLFQELREVLSELDLVKDITVDAYRKYTPGAVMEEGSADIAVVLFDGTNLGLCSDGTLRIAKIVLELLRPRVSCLLIEEPETAVHPGLLDKLLALVDAYSADRQIVLSTHSPQVVDHFSPEQLRLVEREGGITRVHSLSAADRDLALRYLRDQGALSDFVFRRSEG